MKRTTISLPDELAAALEREARRRGTSVSDVAREVLASRFERQGECEFPFIGLGRSGYHDTAERFEEVLAEEWDRDEDRRS